MIVLFALGCGESGGAVDSADVAAVDSAAVDGAAFDGAAVDAGPADASRGVDARSVQVFDCAKSIDPTTPAAGRFDGVASGEVLCLQDGVYSGGLNVPSGITVAALHVGGALFTGGDMAWSEILLMEGEGSTVYGVRIRQPDNSSSNACRISGTNNRLLSSSCAHGGAYKHSIPLIVAGSGHLIEDSWFFGEGRYVVQCFIGDHITFRRNVARWDSTTPEEPNEPNATFSNYNCSYNIWENNVSLDYGVPATPMRYGGDFYSPNNLGVYPRGNIHNQWLGNAAVNHSSETNNRRGLRADVSGSGALVGNIVRDFYVRGNGVGFVIQPSYDFTIDGCTMVDVENGAGQVNTSARAAAVDCGSGADIDQAYIDGVPTNTALWPHTNEALIKADMCATGERQSAWCSFGGSLRDYILGG